MFDLGALESLIALDECGTIGEVADLTGFTPSAVSQKIKRLEAQLEVPLVERVGRNVVLTSHGRRLVADGRDLRRQIETIESGIRAHGERPRGLVKIAAFATAVRGLAAPLLAASHVQAPELRIVVIEDDPADALASLSRGDADFAIVHNWQGVGLRIPAHVATEPLGIDVADLLVPAAHPLAVRAVVAPGDARDAIWSSTPPGTICHDWFLHMYAADVRVPRVDFWCSEYASQIALVRAGVAVALVPRLGRPQLPDGVVAVPVSDPVPTREVSLAWRSSMGQAPVVRFLRRIAHESSASVLGA